MSSAYIPQALQREVRARFGDCCAYCRSTEWLTGVTFEFEHIVPRALDGITTFENLCLSCPMCNRYKSKATFAFDPVSGETVNLYHPQDQVWGDHFEWSKDATVLRGLTAAGRATIDCLKMNRPAVVRVRRMWVEMGEHPPPMG